MRFIITAVILGLSLPAASFAAPKGCPPGLAKKSVPCVPPGQVGKHRGPHAVGDRLMKYIILRDPKRYRLDPRYTYYRSDGYLYRVDPETRKVLNLIGAVADILE
ncbi:excinuclease ABC subunit A [Pseudophaeobacter sp. 1A16562]|uniref:excinuclease ABC subunit A n=1 Tax=Pseudophaeobacter sp. 1A16562 TaxID=3098143 RepID=UPI0034D74C45